jgi:hypothetical protein
VKRTLLVAALACGSLWAWERALAGARNERASAGPQLGRVLPAEERAGRVIAGLRLEYPSGELLTYVQTRGRWRCPSYRGAFADAAAVKALLGDLVEAEGTVQSHPGSLDADYGLAPTQAVRVALLDPRGATALAFELGKQLPAEQGSFLRRSGDERIWLVDALPLERLQREGSGLPPLLERTLVPADWPGEARVLDAIRVERAERAPLELVRRNLPPPPPESGLPPQPRSAWFFAEAEGERACQDQLSFAYATALLLARWTQVLDADVAARADFERPHARILLQPAQGEVLELRIAALGPEGSFALQHSLAPLVYAIDAELLELLTPAVAQLEPGAQTNPWDALLRSATGSAR